MLTEKKLTLHCAGVDINARQRGDSPSVVFLHGFGADLHFWDPLLAALDEPAATLRYDLRDFGGSRAHDPQAYSHTDDLLAVLDACALQRVDLVGVSMGGAVALNCALSHPDRVRRLCLISPALVGWEWSDAWQARWRPMLELARAGDMDGARESWWQHPLFETTRNSDAAALLRAGIERFAGRQWIADPQRPELPDLDRLPGLAAPTLLLTGLRDLPDFLLIADLLAGAVPNLRRVDYPDAGHLLDLERPADLSTELRAFLVDRDRAP